MPKWLVSGGPGHLHAGRIAAHGRDGDRRVRLLQGLVDEADTSLDVDVVHQADVPEFAVELIRRLARPQREDHFDRLGDHSGIVLWIDAVEFQVRGDAAGSEAKVETPLGEMVEKSHAAGDRGRVVLVQADGGGPHPDRLGLAQCPADEHLGAHDVLELHRVVFTDPEFREAQLLGQDDQLQVFIETLAQRLVGVVERHDEHAVVYGRL